VHTSVYGEFIERAAAMLESFTQIKQVNVRLR
jgi:hypothetical protein